MSIQGILEQIKLPRERIQVYGRQITIECLSQKTCQEWASIVKEFARIRGTVRSLIYNKGEQGHNIAKTHKVYRLYAIID